MAKIEQLKFFKQSSLKKVQEEFNNLIFDLSSKKSIRLSLFLTALNLILVAIFFKKLPPELPLFYSRPWGESQLVTKNQFLILPSGGLLILIINLRLASFLFSRELILAKIITWTTTVISLLISISLIKTFLIIFF